MSEETKKEYAIQAYLAVAIAVAKRGGPMVDRIVHEQYGRVVLSPSSAPELELNITKPEHNFTPEQLAGRILRTYIAHHCDSEESYHEFEIELKKWLNNSRLKNPQTAATAWPGAKIVVDAVEYVYGGKSSTQANIFS
jgi:hypothetical protein